MPLDTTLVGRQALDLADTIGDAAKHSLFPRDFEYYALSLELSDYDNNIIDYFTWPVLPSSITKSDSSRVNVKKTASSINVLNNKSFTPQDISIKGNFGRSFKILVTPATAITAKGLSFSQKAGVYSALDTGASNTLKNKVPDFNIAVKSGYGCIKILQSIVDKARGTDSQGRPFKLYLYNPVMGENYLVVPNNNPLMLMTNNNSSNRMFEYTLNLITLSPLEYAKNGVLNGSTIKLTQSDILQKGVNTTASNIKSLL